MRTIAILSRKGGAGKTTLAAHLAVEAAAGGARVLVVDADPQASLADWWRSRAADDLDLVEAAAADLGAVIEAARAAGVDLVLIDTRPAVEADALAAARCADLALIPLQPSVLDLRAVAGTVDLVRAAGVDALAVINRAPTGRGAIENALVMETRAVLDGLGVRCAATVIRNRAAYHAALIDGRAVRELEPKGKAAKETRALWREIVEAMQ
jgi:chromosome partitioning protein